MKALLVGSLCVLAVLFGAISALFGGVIALTVALLSLPLLLVLYDYRVAVVALTVLMPWTSSPLLPQAQGLNVINYLLLLAMISLAAPRLLHGRALGRLPKPTVLLYLLPVCVGLLLAWPHIPQGQINYAGSPWADEFTHVQFLKIRFLKPLGFLIYAWLVSNAVRDSKHPERFLIALGAAALLPAAVVFAAVLMFGGQLTALQSARNFLSPFGMHANEFGLLIMTVTVPLMFIAAAARGVAKALWVGVFVCALAALVLTFSRGAWLGFAVAVLMFLFYARKARYTVVVMLVLLAGIIAAPKAVVERLGTGAGELVSGHVSIAAGEDDALTAGRIGAWKELAPEILRSPLVGRGIGSTAWSRAVSVDHYPAIHPHNLYLEMTMDLGILGLVALLALYRLYIRNFRRLSHDASLPPLLQAYFGGAAAALVGLLVMGVSNGHYMPAPEQTFLWFSLGMLFGYWDRVAQPEGKAAKAKVLPPRRFAYLRY
jgi:O-antigen ligase